MSSSREDRIDKGKGKSKRPSRKSVIDEISQRNMDIWQVNIYYLLILLIMNYITLLFIMLFDTFATNIIL